MLAAAAPSLAQPRDASLAPQRRPLWGRLLSMLPLLCFLHEMQDKDFRATITREKFEELAGGAGL